MADKRPSPGRPRQPGSGRSGAEAAAGLGQAAAPGGHFGTCAGVTALIGGSEMAKKNKKKDGRGRDDAATRASSSAAGAQARSGPPAKLKRREYERQMRVLQGELVALQEWVKESGAKVCVVFEGRDTAGKGGTSSGSPSGSARGCSGSWPCRPRPSGKVADVHPAVPAALPGGRGGGDLRPQLVQPGRREPVMGFCTPQETDGSWSWARRWRRPWPMTGSCC